MCYVLKKGLFTSWMFIGSSRLNNGFSMNFMALFLMRKFWKGFIKINLIIFLHQEVELLIQENDQLQRKLHSQEEEFRLQNQTLMQELSTVSELGVHGYWWTCRCSPCLRLLLNMQEFSTVSEWGVKGYWWSFLVGMWTTYRWSGLLMNLQELSKAS